MAKGVPGCNPPGPGEGIFAPDLGPAGEAPLVQFGYSVSCLGITRPRVGAGAGGDRLGDEALRCPSELVEEDRAAPPFPVLPAVDGDGDLYSSSYSSNVPSLGLLLRARLSLGGVERGSVGLILRFEPVLPGFNQGEGIALGPMLATHLL